MTSDLPVVTGLNIHPIKSCRALPVEQVSLDQYGVVDDRRFMIVDSSGRFVSQRKFPILATVTARYISEGDVRLLSVSAPSASAELRVHPVMEGPRVQCSLWESTVQLVDQGDAAASWFSDLIGRSGFYRLVGCAEGEGGYDRLVENLPPSLRHRLPPMSVGLADAGPVSIVSHASLEDLNTRMRSLYNTDVPLSRFRMNIELQGVSGAFAEDSWLLVRVGDVPFLAYANAERCKMTGIDQSSGCVDKVGPLEVLRSYRAPRGPTHAMFGQLMVPLQSGCIRLGDKVTVLENKKH